MKDIASSYGLLHICDIFAYYLQRIANLINKKNSASLSYNSVATKIRTFTLNV